MRGLRHTTNHVASDRQPARDLSLSLAWALYGAVLLGIGMWRKSTALRGLSLGLVMLTIAKVFLIGGIALLGVLGKFLKRGDKPSPT